MPITSMTEVIQNLGFPIGLVLILIVLIVRYVNKKDKENRADTKEQIAILREENKEDKKIFDGTVQSFNQAISAFKTVNNNMASIESKLNTIEQDITVIKTKMDK